MVPGASVLGKPARRKTFVAFEGGGAKGFVHLASLREIERRAEFELAGFAGTSAGALVAALAAVGYRSTELFHASKLEQTATGERREITSILDILKVEKATDLFGSDWRLMRLLRNPGALKWVFLPVLAIYVALFSVLFFGWIWLATGPTVEGLVQVRAAYWGAFIGVMVITSLVALALLSFLKGFRGLASLERLKAGLDEAMAIKLGYDRTHRVPFGDLRDHGKTLKVVAANLSTGEMRLFSTDSPGCKDIFVADAVAASVAVPLVFKPQRVARSARALGPRAQSEEAQQLYCDGGIVSNLPAWVFEEETVNDARATVIASHISDIAPGAFIGAGFSLLRRIGATAAFGSKSLNMRGVRGLVTLEINSRFGLLDFDYDKRVEAFLEDYYAAWRAAHLQLNSFLAEEGFLDNVFNRISERFETSGDFSEPMQLRASLVREIGVTSDHATPYQLSYCRGFKSHADRYISIRHGGSMVEAGLQLGKPKFLDLTAEDDQIEFYRIDDDHLIRDRTPDCRKWSLVVPLDVPASRDFAKTVAVAFDGAVPLGVKKDILVQDIEAHVGKCWRPED
ncbi:MAG TPA: hypothetical protein ENK63_03805 [Rhodobacterales bacterium]|nr:hypothetical protein [Rhodobacterales bacterium]